MLSSVIRTSMHACFDREAPVCCVKLLSMSCGHPVCLCMFFAHKLGTDMCFVRRLGAERFGHEDLHGLHICMCTNKYEYI